MKNTDGMFGSTLTPGALAAENARFMSKVYAWMTAGICLSGAVAFQVGNTPELAQAIVMNRGIFWMLIIAQLGSVFFLSMAMKRISALVASLVYLLYAALTGLTLSVIFLLYTQESIASVFGLTACSFAGLSAFGYLTKRDLGPVGSFCMMGLFGMVGYGLIALFFPGMMGGIANQVYSAVGIVVFAGLTAYDTQKIKALHAANRAGTEEEKKGAVYGALTLYLDFINLFLSLMRLMGRRK